MSSLLLSGASGSTPDYDIAWEALEQKEVLENPCAHASRISMIEFELIRELICSDMKHSILMQKFRDSWNFLHSFVKELSNDALRLHGQSWNVDEMTKSLYIRKYCPNMVQTFAQIMTSDDIELLDFIAQKLENLSKEDCSDAEISMTQHDVDEWIHGLRSS